MSNVKIEIVNVKQFINLLKAQGEKSVDSSHTPNQIS